jgi:hypothetical protein
MATENIGCFLGFGMRLTLLQKTVTFFWMLLED